MELLARINALDVAIFAALAAGFYMGWRRGLVRQLLAMAGFYVAMVLAAQYHQIIGSWIMSMGTAASWVIVNGIAFVFLFAVVLVLFNWVGYKVYKDTRILVLAQLDGLIGSAFGVLTMALELVIALSLVRFMVSVTWMEWESVRQQVLGYFAGSSLEGVFLAASPNLYVLIRPWLPAGLPAIFSF